jgi:ATP-dependent RNA helicase DeaD
MSELEQTTDARADAESGPDGSPSPFAALGLAPELVSALTALGYEEPTPIQREAIPTLLSGRDLLGQAATGTGKTAAFALPMLQRITAEREGRTGTAALVLVPTRELAMQVAEATHKYGKRLGVTVLPIYGGASMEQQIRTLKRGVDVVVATPGRALDHIRRKTLRLDALKVLVLDEADEMLDMGFEEDLQAILDETPTERQTALFSATMAPRISAIAQRHLSDPVTVRIAREQMTAGSMPKVRQQAYIVPRAHKPATLGRVLDMEAPTSAIVFCRTRTEVDELTETLNGRGYRAEALHGGMSQEQRDRVMKRFRGGAAELLIATDVAARGLDIEHLSHVVNYDVPSAPEAYVHRIGRTGRAGREGVAITIAEPREHRQLRNIEFLIKQKIELVTVPTVADLRARRLELTRASLREALVDDGDLDGFRVVVESLASEFDLMDVAAAAVKLLHAASAGDTAEEQDIPAYVPRDRAPGTERGGSAGPRDRAAGSRFGRDRAPERGERYGGDRGERGGRDRGERTADAPRASYGGDASEDRGYPRTDPRGQKRRERPGELLDATKIYVGAGRKAGVRPADLVGAIANEAGVDSRSIGAIEIADRFSLVELPNDIADNVIAALRSTTIKGKRVPVRRDREI